MSSILEAALRYAARDWPCFPCQPRGKKPLTVHGCKDATTDAQTIRAWWKRWPAANVAIATGPRSFDALDIDGPEGEQALAALEEKHGPLPLGPCQQTGRGRQLFFVGGALGNSTGRLPGIDTRGEGGYVVAAPSIHPNGTPYAMGYIDEPLPECPEWLTAALRGNGQVLDFDAAGPLIPIDNEDQAWMLEASGIPRIRIGEGARNDRLFRYAASLRARGQELPLISRVIALANDLLCEPPLSEIEIRRLIESAAKLEIAPSYRHAFDAAVEKTVSKAASQALETQLLTAAENSEASDQLAHLREAMGVPLLRVTKSGTRPARYQLIVELNGAPHEIPIRNLLAYDEVRRAIFDGATCSLRVKRKNWMACAVLLSKIAETIDPGLSDPPAEIRHILELFMHPDTEGEDISAAETPEAFAESRYLNTPHIQFEGASYIRFDNFRSFYDKSGFGAREAVGSFWARLRECGAVVEVPALFRYGGKVVQRRYWKVIETP
jgi:hypothetical protein